MTAIAFRLDDAAPVRRFYYPQIDGLRFLAYALVLVHHFAGLSAYAPDGPLTPVLERVKAFGWIGVDIFLVLSSFLLFSLLLAEKETTGTVSIRKFYIRRALRIWPLYYLWVLVCVFWAPFFMPAPAPYYSNIMWHQALPMLTFLGNFSYAYFPGSVSNIMSHLWTVSLEEQFYLAVPLVVFFLSAQLREHVWPATISVIAFAMLWRAYMVAAPVPYPMVWALPVTRLDPFAIGALCAVLVRERPSWLQQPFGWVFALASLGGFYLVSCYGQISSGTYHVVWQLAVVSISGAFLLLSVLMPRGLGWVFAWRFLPWLGKVSFGLYVFHLFAMTYANRFVVPETYFGKTELTWALTLLSVFVLNLLLAAGSYYLLEYIFLKRKERFEIVASRPA